MMPWLWKREEARPKDEPEIVPAVPEEQALIDAANALESLVDWRQGNTDSNLILDDRKWGLLRRVYQAGEVAQFNEKVGRWELR